MLFLFIILKGMREVLTFEGFRWGFAGGHLGGKHALAKYLYIKACIVKGHLGILLQLLGQVGPRSGRHGIGSVATVLRDLQLFHKTHRPVEKRVFSHKVYQASSFVCNRGGKHSPEDSVRVWASGGWISDRGLRLWLLFMAFVFPCSSNRAARETKSVESKKNKWLSEAFVNRNCGLKQLKQVRCSTCDVCCGCCSHVPVQCIQVLDTSVRSHALPRLVP